ncbi:hypothetical protein C1646_752624 [Rhizophagus diaphanus]|nr:hypothetical protein C1646_752624 [Rhizophagus diaphanus] [Rhizophagus sp. MUCL 43196]
MSWQRYAIKILATSIGKKLIIFGIANMYGVPRLYRRALEINNKIFKKPETRKFSANLLKQGFLLPNTLSSKLTRKPVTTFPNSSSSIINSSSTSNTVATPYTPSRLVIPSHPNLPTGSIKNPTTPTPITQTTTTTTSASTPALTSASTSTSKSSSESASASTSTNSTDTSFISSTVANPKEPPQK